MIDLGIKSLYNMAVEVLFYKKKVVKKNLLLEDFGN